MNTVEPISLSPVAYRALSADVPADSSLVTEAAQAQGGIDRRLAAGTASGVDQQAVASLRTLVEQPRAVPRGEYVQALTQGLEALNPAERNLFLKTLSTEGTRSLVIELSRQRSGNPAAYAANLANLTEGQPPQQIQRLIDASARLENQSNPAGSQVAHDIAVQVANHGTKGQKLGLIDLMTDPGRGGGVTQSPTKAEAVGELFKGLRGDASAVGSALAMMSQSDKSAVARETLRSDDAAGIAQVLRYTSLGTDVRQRAQMVEQFMTNIDAAPAGERRQAALDGITGNILKSPNAMLGALRREDQDYGTNGTAMGNYLARLMQSDNPQIASVLLTALKYGDDLGGQRSAAQLEALDYSRFNARSSENAATRGYFVGSFDKALAKLTKEGVDTNTLSRNAFTASIYTASGIAGNIPALKPYALAISLTATGLSFVNGQFNQARPVDANAVYDQLRTLARPVQPGTNGAPQLPETGNFGAFDANVNASDRTR